MPDFEAMYPGRFLKGVALDRPRVIKIVAAEPTKLEGDKGERATCVLKYKAKFKIDAGRIVECAEAVDGEIVLNKTNAALTAACFDERDYEKWSGRFITIHFDPEVKFGAEKKGGIRIYGSPQLKVHKRVEIKRPRRKTPEVYELVPTDNDGRAVQS